MTRLYYLNAVGYLIAGIYAWMSPNQPQAWCASALLWAGITIVVLVYRGRKFQRDVEASCSLMRTMVTDLQGRNDVLLVKFQDVERDVASILDPLRR